MWFVRNFKNSKSKFILIVRFVLYIKQNLLLIEINNKHIINIIYYIIAIEGHIKNRTIYIFSQYKYFYVKNLNFGQAQ